MKKQFKKLFGREKTRRVITGLSLCAITSISFGQQQVSEIRRVSEPEYASGYVGWLAETGVDHYEVNIIQMDTNEIVSILSTTSTSQLYSHIDPALFQIGKTGYQILGKNSSGNVIYDSGEVWPAADDLGVEEQCSKTCIGTSYAWKLTCWGKITSQYTSNGVVVNNIGNRYMKLGKAYQYYDNTTGNFTPYWQAVSDNEWTNMGQNQHPYRRLDITNQAIDGSFSYGIYTKQHLDNTSGVGPFYDAQGFSLTDGWLVQKKLNQFIGFEGVTTVNTASFMDCHFDAQGWVNFYNQFDQANTSSWPSSLTWFNLGVTPTSLACVGSSPAGGNTGGGVNGGGISGWWKDLYKYAQAAALGVNTGGSGNTWNDFVKEHNDIGTVGGGTEPSIVEIAISSLTAEGVSVGMEYEEGEFHLTKSAGALVPGLYQVTMFTNDGNAVLAHYGIDFNLPQAKQSEFVEMTVSPNPIEDGAIQVTLDFRSNLSGQLIVHDINGTILHSEAVSESRGEHTRTIFIQSQMVQIFVSLILADGSLEQVQVING